MVAFRTGSSSCREIRIVAGPCAAGTPASNDQLGARSGRLMPVCPERRGGASARDIVGAFQTALKSGLCRRQDPESLCPSPGGQTAQYRRSTRSRPLERERAQTDSWRKFQRWSRSRLGENCLAAMFDKLPNRSRLAGHIPCRSEAES